MSMERPLLLAFQVGIMEAQLKRNIDFCKQRRQSGRAIIENQSISNRIADMAVKFEASKLLLKEIADQLKNKKIPIICRLLLSYLSVRAWLPIPLTQ